MLGGAASHPSEVARRSMRQDVLMRMCFERGSAKQGEASGRERKRKKNGPPLLLLDSLYRSGEWFGGRTFLICCYVTDPGDHHRVWRKNKTQ